MKSRITIDLNEVNEPVIRVQYIESEDVRDKLVKRFLEGFGHSSVWCRWVIKGNDDKTREIYPVKPETMEEEAKVMKLWAEQAK